MSDIDQEITSEQNNRFILHDSEGFVAGETDHYRRVERFITRRSREPELRNQLHAIWLAPILHHDDAIMISHAISSDSRFQVLRGNTDRERSAL